MLFASFFDKCVSACCHILDDGHRIHGVLHHLQSKENKSQLETYLGSNISVAFIAHVATALN
jgi:hypothetical protein